MKNMKDVKSPKEDPMHSASPVLIFLPFMSFMVYIFSFLVCSAMQLKISSNHVIWYSPALGGGRTAHVPDQRPSR